MSKPPPSWDPSPASTAIPPSYEESQSASTFPAQLAQARGLRIASLVPLLLPRLHFQVAAALPRATTLLIPHRSGAALSDLDLLSVSSAGDHLGADASAASAKGDSPAVAASAIEIPAGTATAQDLRPSDEHVTILQLTSADQGSAFWQQRSSGAALANALRARLRAEGHAVDADSGAAGPTPLDATAPSPSSLPSPGPGPASPPLSPPPVSAKKRSFWRRAADAGKDAADDGVGVLHRPVPAERGVAAGRVRVEVETREVALRVCSAMGLWETRTGAAVVVRVEIGVDPDEDGGYGQDHGKR